MICPISIAFNWGDVPGLDGLCHRSGGHISLRDPFDHCIFTVMNKVCFTPFPSIATERFNLRPLIIEDENEIFALRSDDSINEYLDRPKANSIDDARKFIYQIIEGISQDESIFWVISSKDNPALAATICLWKISREHATAEIGYETLKLNAIEAELSPRNLKSVRLLEKYGFVRKDNANKTGEEENPDSVVYTLSNG